MTYTMGRVAVVKMGLNDAKHIIRALVEFPLYMI